MPVPAQRSFQNYAPPHTHNSGCPLTQSSIRPAPSSVHSAASMVSVALRLLALRGRWTRATYIRFADGDLPEFVQPVVS
eukprot:3432330-Rhodomonas_salina.1